MQDQGEYVVIVAKSPYPIELSERELTLQWDAMPRGISDICSDVRDLLVAMGEIDQEESWTPFLSLESSVGYPAKKIRLLDGSSTRCAKWIEAYAKGVKEGDYKSSDMFTDPDWKPDNIPLIDSAVRKTQQSLSGKLLEIPLKISSGGSQLAEIAGTIAKPQKQSPVPRPDLARIVAHVDEPSTKNHRLTVRPMDGTKAMSLRIDTRKFLDLIYRAMTTSLPCALMVKEELDGDGKLALIVVDLELLSDSDGRPLWQDS